MDKIKNIAMMVAVAVIISLGIVFVTQPPQQPPLTPKAVQVGAASPILPYPYFGFGGATLWAAKDTFDQTSRTACSMQSPEATSTLLFASAQIETGTTTALVWEWGKGTSVTATTTSLGRYNTASNVTGTLLASTTIASGLTYEVTPAQVFGYSTSTDTYLNLNYANASASNVLVGTCYAVWVQNS